MIKEIFWFIIFHLAALGLLIFKGKKEAVKLLNDYKESIIYDYKDTPD